MGKDKSSQPPVASPEMDPGIWSQLPEVLLELVLSFLPLKNFLSLRSTCKNFKSLIFSPSFPKHPSKHSSSSSSHFSLLLLSHPHFHLCYPLYDAVPKTWRNLPLPISPLLSCAPSSQHLLSVSHGLLCFSLPNSSSFLVYNLLARSSRVVKFPQHPFAFELLTLVSTSNGYKLFMLNSSSGSSQNAFVYDSRLQLWHQFDRVDSALVDNSLQQGVSYNGCLYFTTPEPFSIMCFDLEIGRWEKLMTELPGELTFVRLVTKGDDEKLLLIAGIGQHGISRELKVWELREGNWVEIAIAPEPMCRKFMSICYHNYEHVYAFWHQGLICLCCYNWPEILYYKVSRRSWRWLPKCPSLPEKWSCGFRWFSLVPELHASV